MARSGDSSHLDLEPGHDEGNRKDGAFGPLHRQTAEERPVYGRDDAAGVGQ
jgi:hypothetical protein